MTLLRERKRIFLAVLCLLAVFLVRTGIGQEADESSKPPALNPSPAPDRSDFMGARACIDCHRSEYVSWLNTAHYHNPTSRFEASENSIDTKYRALAGNVDLCYSCHSVPKTERFGRRFVESGTSCESCHGAAGGDDGWLNQHAVYGPNVTRMEHETSDHLTRRIARCEASGMVRSERQYQVARNCFSCHIIGDANLLEAGHKSSFDNFSLIPYLLGEVRHNFHLNQRQNARSPSLLTARQGASAVERVRVYFIVEQLARMQVSLTAMARLPTEDGMEGEAADAMMDIFDDAAGQLEEFAEVLLEEPNTAGEVLTEADVDTLVTAVDLFSEFDELDPPTRADAAATAEAIDQLATQFEQLHNGRKLEILDSEFLEDLGDPVGNALEP